MLNSSAGRFGVCFLGLLSFGVCCAPATATSLRCMANEHCNEIRLHKDFLVKRTAATIRLKTLLSFMPFVDIKRSQSSTKGLTMDEESHWNKIAHSYEDEIFDVFGSDKNKKLPQYFSKYANDEHVAIDLGCGIGKAFPYLSPAFSKVIAVDISDKCLDIAANKEYDNIEFRKADLTDPDLQLPQADFAFCCNVLLLPDLEKNIAMIRNAHKTVKRKSGAVFVMPSLDSILLYAWRLIEWNRKEGVEPEEIPDDEFSYFSGSKRDLFQGLIKIEGVTTKHYSHSEIEVIFKEAGFNIETIDKVEYEWTTEFVEPPKWLKAPYPWDWLVEVSK